MIEAKSMNIFGIYAEIKNTELKITKLKDLQQNISKIIDTSMSLIKKRETTIEYLSDKANVYSTDDLFYYDGELIKPEEFDEYSCHSIFNAAEKELIKSFSIIFKLAKENVMSSTSLPLMKEASLSCAKSYNTIVEIYNTINSPGFDKELESNLSKLEKHVKELEKAKTAKEKEIEAAQNEIKKEIFFFEKNDQETEFVDELKQIPIGYSVLDNGNMAEICHWNPNKHNILHIKVDESLYDTPALSLFLQNTIFHFLNNYPIGGAQWSLCDLCGYMDLNKVPARFTRAIDGSNIARIYRKYNKKTLYAKKDDLSDFSENLSSLIEKRAESIDNITLFNANHKDMPQPLLLNVIDGYTFDMSSLNKVSDTLKYGGAVGIYLIVVETTSKSYLGKPEISAFDGIKQAIHLEFTKDDKDTIRFTYGGNEKIAITVEAFDIKSYSSIINNRLENSKPFVDMCALVDEHNKNSDEDFSRTISIPIGKTDDAEIKHLTLRSDDSSAHCAIYGTTGSGKSSLLQAIILGGAAKYSPEELEFYLVDMKGGTAFHANEYDYSKLKHVKLMATSNTKQSDLRELISHIINTRFGLINGNGAANIIDYNKRNEEAKIPRIFLIIDEYTEITDERCIEDLARIARQGRAYGISLVLSSTTSGNRKILNNVSTYVEFTSKNYGALISDDSTVTVSKNDVHYLNSQIGNFLIREGDAVTRCRAAYCNDQNSLIEKINAGETSSTIVIGDEKRDIDNWKNAKKTAPPSILDDKCKLKFTAILGNDLFTKPMSVTFNSDLPELLLYGDNARALSIELSVASAFTTDVESGCRFLNFGPALQEDVSAALENYCSVSFEVDELCNSIETLYEEYLHRKKEYEANERTNPNIRDTFPPLLTIVNQCDKYSTVLGKLNESHSNNTFEDPDALSMDFLADIPDDLYIEADVDEEYLASYEPEEDSNRLQNTDKKTEENPAQRRAEAETHLTELISDAGKYNMYFVVHVNGSENEQAAKDISKLFKRIVTIPSCSEGSSPAFSLSENEVKMISKLFNFMNGRFDSNNNIFKEETVTPKELCRCYYVVGNEYTQFIPYEWR